MPTPIPPPPVWKEASTKEGRKYYYNATTNETRWTKPDELMTPEERATVGTDWDILSHEGRPYWAHKETKLTRWEPPDQVKANLDRMKPPPSGPPAGNHWAAGPSIPTGPRDQGRFEREPVRERDSYQPDRRDRDRERDSGFGGGERAGPSFAPANELQFANPSDAVAAFHKVLKSLKVQPDWEWTRAVRAGIKDPNWRAIPEPEKREEAFRKYCENLRLEEKNKEQSRQEKLRADFMAMLRSHPEIKHYTRWKTARPILEDETIFRSAKDDEERRRLFEEYIVTLKQSHVEQEKDDRRAALDELMTLMQDMELEPFTRWHAAEEQLKANQTFNSEKFQPLHRSDILNTFETHIRQLQRDHNDRVQAANREKLRIERKNRDGFKQLLRELQNAGKLGTGTKWKEIHPLVEDDARYTAMLGQTGSSPIDLFWDVIEAEEQKFRALRRVALDALLDERYEVTTSTPYEEFVDVMRANPRTKHINDQTMKNIFDYVLAKVKKREAEEQQEQEHDARHAMDDLRAVLKRLEPPVTLTDTWETVRPRVEKTKEYNALKSDSLRQSAFDKYMRRLKEKESDRRDRVRRDTRDREERDSRKDRDKRDRRDDREYRNGHSDSHRRHRTRTRSPEHDSYAAERRRAQEDREARYRNSESTGLSPPYRRRDDRGDRARDTDRYSTSRRGSDDFYAPERRTRDSERTDRSSYIPRGDPAASRADPRERSVSELDYGDGTGARTTSTRRRRESDESSARRDTKRARYSPRADRKSKTPVPDPLVKEEERTLRSGSEEGEIEED
ncbi:hypothetical protein BU23DRAFT_466556 [Bimuria novae-zelandiae CBS 107.79]|uniref:U1 snRNP-associated protein Usp104 n=1 Tax=Bimuria novae-zelandiae CBS 107.79 TaxID=1447943 RepID=A0A6A5V722_9PLEO|nr:hypothetical protein BU23DRAFT_466556 [Bimuria novae-zelandiae CBS 107.79]